MTVIILVSLLVVFLSAIGIFGIYAIVARILRIDEIEDARFEADMARCRAKIAQGQAMVKEILGDQ